MPKWKDLDSMQKVMGLCFMGMCTLVFVAIGIIIAYFVTSNGCVGLWILVPYFVGVSIFLAFGFRMLLYEDDYSGLGLT